MIATLNQSSMEAILMLFYVSTGFLSLFVLGWIVVRVPKLLDIWLRKKMHKNTDTYKDADGRVDILNVLPDLSREELTRIATDEKELLKTKEEIINIDNYDGLPLRPKIYFDPEKDKGSPGDEPPKPKIERSILSNEPVPKEEEPAASVDEPIEEESSAEPSPWMPITLKKEKEQTSPVNDDVTDDTKQDES